MNRMRLADLRPRNVYTAEMPLWDTWGDSGASEMLNGVDNAQDPHVYYANLREYMAAGGTIEPLIVAGWTLGKRGQTYVFNGHHRYAIAQELGWQFIDVEASGYAPNDVDEVLPLSRSVWQRVRGFLHQLVCPKNSSFGEYRCCHTCELPATRFMIGFFPCPCSIAPRREWNGRVVGHSK